jgi:hypothetical protein
VVAWGCGERREYFDGGQCTVSTAASSGVTAIAGGAYHSLALKAGDTVPCTVPQVVGKALASAKGTLAAAHCRTGRVGYAYSRRSKKGIVTAQSRRAGQMLQPGAKIDLTVSRGRKR